MPCGHGNSFNPLLWRRVDHTLALVHADDQGIQQQGGQPRHHRHQRRHQRHLLNTRKGKGARKKFPSFLFFFHASPESPIYEIPAGSWRKLKIMKNIWPIAGILLGCTLIKCGAVLVVDSIKKL